MVVKMMRWRPWPPLISRKYEVNLKVLRLEGCDWVDEGVDNSNGGLSVEIRWKGPKISFRRSVKRNCTKEVKIDAQNGGVLVDWDEDFQSVCSLSGYKDNVFHYWEINFSVLHGLNQGTKNKTSVLGSASLNLAEYASKIEGEVIEIKIPLTVPSIAIERRPLLTISLGLVELRAAQAQESMELIQSPIIETSSEKDEISALKAGLRKVKMFTDYVSIKRAKKASSEEGSSESRSSPKSEEGEYTYHSFELEELEGGSDQEKEDSRKTFSYGTLAHVNYAGISSARTNYENEDWVYYSNRRRSDVGSSSVQDLDSTINEQPLIQNSKRSILPWKKRKLSFRSPKSKGEPLLKKAYGEEGGDDIDYDRRQLSSDESLSFGWRKIDEDSNANRSSISEFGDDNFAVGTWERKEITSRDGQMKIQTEVFFASIDQRNERASGESACTALVAVLADWLHNNHNLMPIKSQFDSLIRDGSLEWRNLCENETYMQRFPDKHFDLETVLQAKIRNLCVVSEKSFIGFFHPDGMEEGNFDFLHGAMSFENIWDEISQSEYKEAQVFIVSWNDHFFVLKVDRDAYYIIDTLGERLHEGCSEAYILKFDKDTTIYKLPSKKEPMEKEPEEPMEKETEDEVFCKGGKETCKEYIKNFLAAIPIRELQADMKRGLLKSTPLHQRLQIEFHFTQSVEEVVDV